MIDIESDYYQPEGEEISDSDLTLETSKRILRAIKKLNYFNLIRTIKFSQDNLFREILIFDINLSIPQIIVNEINNVERIAIKITKVDDPFPEVWALRNDFPNLPHINLREYSTPKSLCIYDNFEESQLTWTPEKFLCDIKQWLEYSAVGKLHQDNQPLEPFLMGNHLKIILPSEFFNDDNVGKSNDVSFCVINPGNDVSSIVWKAATDDTGQRIRIISVGANISIHGVINKKPHNLIELNNLLFAVGINIYEIIKQHLTNFEALDSNDRPKYIVLLVVLPKKRELTSSVEIVERWTFLIDQSVEDLGVSMGLWEKQNGVIAKILFPEEIDTWKEIGIIVCNTYCEFDRITALKSNGITSSNIPLIALIGVGAIGSQIFLNLVRMGIGRWKLIDNDILLPHNLARHGLTSFAIGHSKAESLSFIANKLLNDEVASAYPIKISEGSKMPEQLVGDLADCQFIIDASTSISVSRILSNDIESKARRFSCFLNPIGCDAVLLCEDKERKTKLDSIEMQYYRLCIENASLKNHLSIDSKTIRYSNSCREVSNTLSQSNVAILSGILSSFIQKKMTNDEATISIFQLNENNLSVTNIHKTVYSNNELEINGWKINYDDRFLDKLKKRREVCLPKETGGAIVGCHDMKRKIVYLIDTSKTPIDSIGTITSFDRGYEGLKDEVVEISKATGGMVTYLGEWHSHPSGCSTKASRLDKNQLNWCKETMSQNGIPAVMVIVGDANEPGIYLELPDD